MKKARLLYVEDDKTLSFITKDNLEMNGYIIDYCDDGEKALLHFKNNNYDLCILDVMLPKLDGFSVAKQIRVINQHIPIIFLSARSTKEDKISGLKTGADDYITKPFSIEELILKIEVFLRRSKVITYNISEDKIFDIGKFNFDFRNLILKSDNFEKKLTYKESELIKYLFDNRNRVIKREELLVALWGDNDYFMGRSLDVFISRLRKYFSLDKSIRIDTMHGIGFKFVI